MCLNLIEFAVVLRTCERHGRYRVATDSETHQRPRMRAIASICDKS